MPKRTFDRSAKVLANQEFDAFYVDGVVHVVRRSTGDVVAQGNPNDPEDASMANFLASAFAAALNRTPDVENTSQDVAEGSETSAQEDN